MAAITSTQLENAASDADSLSHFANDGASPGIYTTRTGRVGKTLAYLESIIVGITRPISDMRYASYWNVPNNAQEFSDGLAVSIGDVNYYSSSLDLTKVSVGDEFVIFGSGSGGTQQVNSVAAKISGGVRLTTPVVSAVGANSRFITGTDATSAIINWFYYLTTAKVPGYFDIGGSAYMKMPSSSTALNLGSGCPVYGNNNKLYLGHIGANIDKGYYINLTASYTSLYNLKLCGGYQTNQNIPQYNTPLITSGSTITDCCIAFCELSNSKGKAIDLVNSNTVIMFNKIFDIGDMSFLNVSPTDPQTGRPHGLQLTGGTGNSKVVGNSFERCAQAGVQFYQSPNNVLSKIHNNRFKDNGYAAIVIEEVNGLVDIFDVFSTLSAGKSVDYSHVWGGIYWRDCLNISAIKIDTSGHYLNNSFAKQTPDATYALLSFLAKDINCYDFVIFNSDSASSHCKFNISDVSCTSAYSLIYGGTGNYSSNPLSVTLVEWNNFKCSGLGSFNTGTAGVFTRHRFSNCDFGTLSFSNSNAGAASLWCAELQRSVSYSTLTYTANDIIFENSDKIAVEARLSADTSNDKTGDGTQFALVCGEVTSNNKNCYNSSTGVFTAPRKINVLAKASVSFANVGAAHTYGAILIIATLRTFKKETGNPANLRNSANRFCDISAEIISMEKGDTLSFAVDIENGTKIVGISNFTTISIEEI